jgi:hypothetical protein
MGACGSGGGDQEDHSSKLAWVNGLRDPISKTPNTKKAQVVKHLPSKSEALSSNSNTTKEK